MKTILLMALCLASFTACHCDIEEDETKKKSDMKMKSDTLKIK